MNLIDRIAQKAGWVVVGRLRTSGVRKEALNALKRELIDWNMKTGKWREEDERTHIQATPLHGLR